MARGIAFIGPTPEQIRAFGLKHTARELAQKAGLPLLPGTGLLRDAEHALREAERIGYPVMLKSSAGGGGIGMQLARNEAELRQVFASVQRLSQSNFGDGSVFLERFIQRARHLEVQLFGDGRGNVAALSERDCSAQRRNQKVIEETPAPLLKPAARTALLEAALALGKSVGYRSAGTVEFVYDADRAEFYFLEVNTRLQVEHPVTEAVHGIDLVEWMVRTAAGEPPDLSRIPAPLGHAIEVRVYAEDPAREFRPSAGQITALRFPESGARIDSWVEISSEVTAFYDPMLAKLIVHGTDRADAVARLERALEETEIAGIETNVRYLRALARHPAFVAGELITQSLAAIRFSSPSVEVLSPGTFSILVDHPGRLGYWDVGIPPSGPMDALAHQIAQRLVGNPDHAVGLELTISGPSLRFASDAVIALGGAHMPALLDGEPLGYWRAHEVRAGQTLKLGVAQGGGCRSYLAVRGGFDVPEYLGSRTTFVLGGFGGHSGRTLRRGDVLHLGNLSPVSQPVTSTELAGSLAPSYGKSWQLGVLYGPHGAPDFFTPGDIEQLFSTEWEVHPQSNRTGVRLIGPKPEWARKDGGEAGLHPSNIHDVAYAVGGIDFTGDMPILLGPDGPSLGGFVTPGVVCQAELWKLGQLCAGDHVRFVPVSREAAAQLREEQTAQLRELNLGSLARPRPQPALRAVPPGGAILREIGEGGERVVYRQQGDAYLLVEYGPLQLDLRLRMRVHALMQWLDESRIPGILDVTPGIRSLQIHFDTRQQSAARLLDALKRAEVELTNISDLVIESREVHLPLSWDDPATRLAIAKYSQVVRADAPWCPSNIEFIRRINGLGSEREVYDIVFGASYLVLGLGDVYLGAPVATPLDPRQRLVTTKYNPARTWTPENAVGIGGAYLCIYGMEGPGGYQFVGRTLQMYNRFRSTRDFVPGTPWLLRFFDQIRFYPVGAQELLELRADFLHGRVEVKTEPRKFRLSDYEHFLAESAGSIEAFKAKQQRAFEEERQRWAESASHSPGAAAPTSAAAFSGGDALPAGVLGVESHVSGSVWKLLAAKGTRVSSGDPLVIVESMKMEVAIEAPSDGTVLETLASEGMTVSPGQRLLTLAT